MELKELHDKSLEVFGVDSSEELSRVLLDASLNDNPEIFDRYVETFPDLTVDQLQPIYQYYLADRKDKKQDFTPVCLADLVCRLVNVSSAESVFDPCAGSGALLIRALNYKKDIRVVCKEVDKNVVPFLLFNLKVRNASGVVIHGNAIQNERVCAYYLTQGERYSTVVRDDEIHYINSPEVCICNPPYNLIWNPDKAIECIPADLTPPKSNANFAFVLAGVSTTQRSAFILPNGVNTSSMAEEVAIRAELVENNLLEAVISNPEHMFESTSIPTSILYFNHSKQRESVAMIDAREQCAPEERLQRGQFGGASHTGRVYRKTVNVYRPEDIDLICRTVKDGVHTKGVSSLATLADIQENGYNISPPRYTGLAPADHSHRPYADIVDDLNRVTEQKNSCKLLINRTIAERLGIDVSLFEKDAEFDKSFGPLEAALDLKITKSDCFTATKNKGEITFKNNTKDGSISFVFEMIFPEWKRLIMFLNKEQNRYLAELRDALLPDLMEGRIQIDGDGDNAEAA